MNIKKKCRFAVQIFLSLQLVCSPYYGYADPPQDNSSSPKTPTPSALFKKVKNTFSENLLNDLKSIYTKGDPKTRQKIQSLVEMAKAVEQNRLQEYLEEHPDFRHSRDIFHFGGQTAESLKYHFDSDAKQFMEIISKRVDLNDYQSRPLEITATDIEVKYNSETRELVFEGKRSKKTVIRQHIPNLDIIDFHHDKDLLVLLDRERGILVVDMIFVKAYIGTAPFPLIPIPSNSSGFSIEDNLKIEFVHRGVKPPDIIPNNFENIIDKNFNEEAVYSAGSIMVSFTDADNSKTLVEWVERDKIMAYLTIGFETIDAMIHIVSPNLMTPKDLNQLVKELIKTEQNEDIFLDSVSDSFFHRDALYQMIGARQGVKARIDHTDHLGERDRMLYKEWQESFSAVEESLKQTKRRQELLHGNVLTTETLAKLITQSEERKKISAQSVRVISEILSKGWDWAKRNKTILTASTGVVAAGLVFDHQTALFLEGLYNFAYKNEEFIYSKTSGINFPFLIALPFVFYAATWASVPFVKFIKNLVPERVRLGNKVYHPQGRFQDFIDKWEDTNAFQRLTGVSLKIMAYAIYPFWNYIPRLLGQPYMVKAWSRGLNPFKKITPDSDIGQTAGIEKPVYIGSQGLTPQWKPKEEEKFQHIRRTALAKKSRIEILAWLMAVMAVTKETNIHPVELIVFGTAGLDLNKINTALEDEKLKNRILWVKRHLAREITQLGQIDMRESLTKMDPQMIVRYYDTAKELAEKAASHSSFRQKTRRILYKDNKFMNAIRRNLNPLHWNRKEHDLLKKIPTEITTERTTRELLVDHSMVVLLPALTTERAHFSLEGLDLLALHADELFISDKPHLSEIFLDAYAYLFIASAQNAMTFKDKRRILDPEYAEASKTYEPLEGPYLSTKPYRIKDHTYIGKIIGYLASGGKEGTNNLGYFAQTFYWPRLRSLQMTLLITFLGFRMLFTDQGAVDASKAFLLFHFSALWVFGWPWLLIHGGHQNVKGILAENTNKIESLKLKFSRIGRKIFENEEQALEEYKSAMNELVDHYIKDTALKDKLIDGLENLNPGAVQYIAERYQTRHDLSRRLRANQFRLNLKEASQIKQQMEIKEPYSVDENLESAVQTAKYLSHFVAGHPPFAHQQNPTADYFNTAIMGGFLTTYLFVTLSIWTFDPAYLTTENIASWAAINYAMLGGLYLAYSKGLKEWKTFFYEKFGLKSSMEYARQKIKQPGNTAEKPEESKLRRVVNACRRLFTRS